MCSHGSPFNVGAAALAISGTSVRPDFAMHATLNLRPSTLQGNRMSAVVSGMNQGKDGEIEMVNGTTFGSGPARGWIESG